MELLSLTAGAEAAETVAETTQAALRDAYETGNGNFPDALLMTAIGLIGIFVVIGAIALLVTGLNKLGGKKKPETADKD